MTTQQPGFSMSQYASSTDLFAAMIARITDLEAQLEAIGAGGVSGPLIGQPQAMPDLSQLTERGAKAWAGVDAQGLREGGASHSANAGEPSAHIKEPYTLAEIKAKIASNDYSAEMLLQHAMLLLDSASLSANAGQAGEYQALVCDYCGAFTPDPWHSSGMLHGKMSKHIHSCDACASHGQAPAQPDQPIACSYGDNGYACCEGGPCQADVHNDKLAEQQAPQPVAREPLTPERVKEIVRGAGYDQCGIPETERAAFINGLRHGEQAHGIKVGQHG